MEELGKSVSKKAKMDTVLSGVFKSESNERRASKETEPKTSIPSTSAGRNKSDDEEDLGVPVILDPKKPRKRKKSSLAKLDARWTRFFKDYREKLKIKTGRKQFVVRIRKYLESETHEEKIVLLKKFRKCIQSDNYEKMMELAKSFQNFLAKNE